MVIDFTSFLSFFLLLGLVANSAAIMNKDCCKSSIINLISLFEVKDFASPREETASSTVPYVSTRRSDFEVLPPNSRFVSPLSQLYSRLLNCLIFD